MIAAIMQPYFFPYIGYFQLMRAVDVFVFFDDVQYINRGWVNRNQVKRGDKPVWLTMPVHKASRTLPICQRFYILEEGAKSTIEVVRASYAKAPAFHEIFPLVNDIASFGEPNVAEFNAHLLKRLATELDLTCSFEFSSKIEKPQDLKGEDKIVDLCLRIGATHYVNPIGGIELYDNERFSRAGLKLSFLKTTIQPPSFDGQEQHLSIIDDLMNYGIDGVVKRSTRYELREPGHVAC